MSLSQKLGRGSFFYTASNILQRGISFLLLPLYTHYLTPNDYGILAVVTTLNGFLAILFTLSMHAAVNRFYFDFRDQPETLKEFWGTVITTIWVLSIVSGAALLLTGEYLLKPVMGDIPFWPYFALGIGALIFQPFFQIFLSTLQVRGQAGLYVIFSTSQFFLNLLMVVALVVLFEWHAEGPLFAMLATSIVFSIVALVYFKKDFKFVFRKNYLMMAAGYSLPLVPHSLSAQILMATDKFFLNSMMDAATAGLYHIAFLLGATIAIVGDNINRAYVPVAMEALTESSADILGQLKRNGTILMSGYCLLGVGVSLFSEEVLRLFTTEAYYPAYKVVPFIAFGFVMGNIYYVLVNILMYKKEMTKWVSIGTLAGAVVNVVLNLLLIPSHGMLGAAWATLVSQLVMAVVVGRIGFPLEPFRWDYGKISVAFIACATISFLLTGMPLVPSFGAVLMKVLVSFFMILSMGSFVFGDSWFFFRLLSRWRTLLHKPVSTG